MYVLDVSIGTYSDSLDAHSICVLASNVYLGGKNQTQLIPTCESANKKLNKLIFICSSSGIV